MFLCSSMLLFTQSLLLMCISLPLQLSLSLFFSSLPVARSLYHPPEASNSFRKGLYWIFHMGIFPIWKHHYHHRYHFSTLLFIDKKSEQNMTYAFNRKQYHCRFILFFSSPFLSFSLHQHWILLPASPRSPLSNKRKQYMSSSGYRVEVKISISPSHKACLTFFLSWFKNVVPCSWEPGKWCVYKSRWGGASGAPGGFGDCFDHWLLLVLGPTEQGTGFPELWSIELKCFHSKRNVNERRMPFSKNTNGASDSC